MPVPHFTNIRFALLALALTASACRTRPNQGTGPYADRVAEYVPQIEDAVGVKFKTPPKLELRSRDEVRQFLLQQFDEQKAASQVAGEDATFKVFGLIPDTMNLRGFLVRVLTEQIIGFYDPKTKVLYVVKGAPDDVVGLTIAHELVHALQDQYVNLDSLEKDDDDDRALAAQAVAEGQATLESTTILLGGKASLAAKLPGGWESLRQSIRDAESAQPVFASAPMVIQETLLFPYINGADFVRRFKERHPNEEPWARFPLSTEQVMHDSAYEQNDKPIAVTLPGIPNTLYTNDMGEFGTRLVILQHLGDTNAAIRASNGWGGDRYTVFKAGSGTGVVWASAWDTPFAAAQFVTTIGDAMARRYRTPLATNSGVKTITTNTRTVRIEQKTISGRNVVLFTDVPAGVSPTIVNIGSVKIGQ